MSDLNLNPQLFSYDSPLVGGTVGTQTKDGSTFDGQISSLNVSKINLKEFVKRASGDLAYGTFTSSHSFTITSTLAFKSPNSSAPTFGKPIVAIYQGNGTAGANQIYPAIGANVTLGRYDVTGGEIDYASYNGVADQWKIMITDTNGTSAQAFTVAAYWIFLDYVSGDGTSA